MALSWHAPSTICAYFGIHLGLPQYVWACSGFISLWTCLVTCVRSARPPCTQLGCTHVRWAKVRPPPEPVIPGMWLWLGPPSGDSRQETTFHSTQPLSTLHLSTTASSPPCLPCLPNEQWPIFYYIRQSMLKSEIAFCACFSIDYDTTLITLIKLDFLLAVLVKTNILLIKSSATSFCPYSLSHSLPSFLPT